jgi:hypothetical protein
MRRKSPSVNSCGSDRREVDLVAKVLELADKAVATGVGLAVREVVGDCGN